MIRRLLTGRRGDLAAIALIGVGATTYRGEAVGLAAAFFCVPVGVALIVSRAVGGWHPLEEHSPKSLLAVGLAPVFFVMLAMAEPYPGVWALIAWVALTAVGVAVAVRSANPTPWLVTLAGLGALAAVVLSSHGVLDVTLFHRDASVRLLAGENPYTGLSVPNGAPGSTTVITGYPYPLSTLLPFTAAWALFRDPRVALVVGWIGFGLVWWRLARTRRTVAAPLALVALLVPTVPNIVWGGFTEPVTLVLIALAVLVWRRPVWAGVLLGVALGSKQYLAALVPLVALARFDHRLRRLVATGLAAMASGGAGLFYGSTYVDAAVRFHLEQPPRWDATNLFGLTDTFSNGVATPAWLALVLSLGLAVWLGIRCRSRSSLLFSMAAVLSVGFFFGSQAFSNYWFLVLELIYLGLLTASVDRVTPEVSAEHLA